MKLSLNKILLSVLSFVSIILCWTIVAYFINNTELIPFPTQVIFSFFTEMEMKELFNDLLSSLYRVTLGFILASITGVILGLICGLIGIFGKIVTGMIDYLKNISPIAWIPISIILFKAGTGAAVAVIFIAAFFPIFINTVSGTHLIDKSHRLLGTSLSLSKWQTIRHIIWPSSLPHIFTGLRVGLGFGWMAVIASEMVQGSSGVGYSIQIYRQLLNTNFVIIYMVIIGLVGYLMNLFLVYVSEKLLPWTILEEK